jgi:hypothetical protein
VAELVARQAQGDWVAIEARKPQAQKLSWTQIHAEERGLKTRNHDFHDLFLNLHVSVSYYVFSLAQTAIPGYTFPNLHVYRHTGRTCGTEGYSFG